MFTTANQSFMDTSAKQIKWHYETLPEQTKKALDFLSGEKWLKESKWYLAGGTALALQAGHRRSVDLDFFTEEKNFNEKWLVSYFADTEDWQPEVEEKNTIYGQLLKSRTSFIAYPFFVPKQEPLWHGSVRVLNKIDIAVMKITAISQRGRKRDFFDLYWCAKNLEPLEETIKKLPVQYPAVAHNYHHILKSLVYFEDAEGDPEPEIFFKANWDGVKQFFNSEIPIITKHVIGLN